ncbi:hypothetical protein [Microlunatus ginsengisoli]|uniref:DUF1461 domain-containing protein n=1 Tax=Microlunatus ginsengisoli TaxID=363863 RepID=A0ABP7AUC7_9ACTN
MRTSARLSATTFGLAMLCASLWWSAFTTMTLLHDDAKFVHALGAVLDSPPVRSAVADWVTDAVDAAGGASGRDLRANPVLSALHKALASDRAVGPLTDAVVAVVLPARNAAVAQLDAKLEPKKDVRLDLAPVFKAAGISLDKKSAAALGLTVTKHSASVPLLTGQQLDTLQRRYDLALLAETWAGWAALVLLAVSVATSAKPLRTLAIACGALALLAVVAPWLLGRVAGWLGSGDLGPLLTPVVATTRQAIGPYTLPALIVGLVAALGFGAAQFALTRQAHSRNKGAFRDVQ